MTTETSPLAMEIANSLSAHPERWAQHDIYAMLCRDDGVTIWSDATAMVEPRDTRFNEAERELIMAAIEQWELGPLSGKDQEQ